MSQREYAISRGSTVVVTGANGYIASHVIDVLLELGFNVRGTVRSEKPWLDQLFEQKYGLGRYQSVVVPRMDVGGAFDEVTQGVGGFIHIASDISLSPDPNTVIPNAVKMVVNALEAAANKPSIKRFVLLSSLAAVITLKANQKGIIDKNTWNDEAVTAAWDETTPPAIRPYVVYAASKVESERSAWRWVETHKPGYVFNTVVPDFNSGKILHPEISGSAMGWARRLLEGDRSILDAFPSQHYIDVRDCACLQVASLLDPAIQNERIFAFAGPFNWTDIIILFRRLRPDNKKIPNPPTNEGRDLFEIKPKKKAEAILRSFFSKGWTGLEESFAAGIEGRE